ncbi:MAG: RHS repeat-associated core domain-containing protein [Oscillospiraceae bacterium]|nr:RHS repeat-associated core domain-containing protein [Oscillospiraceae bacterium]
MKTAALAALPPTARAVRSANKRGANAPGSFHIGDSVDDVAKEDKDDTGQEAYTDNFGLTRQNETQEIMRSFIPDYGRSAANDLMVYEEGQYKTAYVYGLTGILSQKTTHLINEIHPLTGVSIDTTGEHANVYTDNAVAVGVLYHHQTYLGSSDYTTDKNGEIRSWADYDVWGAPKAGVNHDLNLAVVIDTAAFTGYAYDGVLELYFAQFRFYDAQARRFTQEDPARSGRNWYTYVGNDPVNWVDPYGLFFAEIGGFFTGVGNWIMQAGTDIANWTSTQWTEISAWTTNQKEEFKNWAIAEFNAAVAKVSSAFKSASKHFMEPDRAGNLLLGVAAAIAKGLIDSGGVPLSATLDLVNNLTANFTGTTYTTTYYENYIGSSDKLFSILAGKVTHPDSFYLGKTLGDIGLMGMSIGLGATGIATIVGSITVGAGGTVGGATVSATGVGAIVGIPAIIGSIEVAVAGVGAGAIELTAAVAMFMSGAGSVGDDLGNFNYFNKLDCDAETYSVDWSRGRAATAKENLMKHFDKHGSEVGAKDLEAYAKKARSFRDTVLNKRITGNWGITILTPEMSQAVLDVILQFIDFPNDCKKLTDLLNQAIAENKYVIHFGI